MSLRDEHGRQFNGIPVRGRYSSEKEAGLYVDFDDELKAFVLPAWRVPPVEALGRTGVIGSLALTAAGVHDVLTRRDSEFRFEFMSKHVRRLWTGFVPQDEMIAAFRAAKHCSEQHATLVSEMEAQFMENRAVLRKSLTTSD